LKWHTPGADTTALEREKLYALTPEEIERVEGKG